MQQINNSFSKRNALLAPRLIKALKNRKIRAYYCADATEAVEKALSLISPGSTLLEESKSL